MNRPLKRKLENLLLAFLDANKSGTAFAAVTLVTGSGTTLAAEIARDDAATAVAVPEPQPPFLAISVLTQADPDLPGVASFEAVLHLKTDATAPASDRLTTDAILRDIYNVMIRTADDDNPFSDSNHEFALLLTFANKPVGTDSRPTYLTPLHVYGIWHTQSPTLFDDENWHDQLVFAGHAQDMNSSE